MRILHISTRLILGGSQENTVLSCEGQARLGHDVHLAFGPIYGPEGSMLERVRGFRTPDGHGITTHEVPSLVREIDPARDRAAFREIAALIERLRPDVVHTHSSKAGVIGRGAAWRVLEQSRDREGAGARDGSGEEGYDGDSRRPASSRSRLRCAVIHTVHGPPFMPVEGSAARRARTRLVNHLYTLAERYAARRCHLIVSVADAMTRQFLARGIGRPEQYVTVSSGMETEQYLDPEPGESREATRARLGLAQADFVIGTVARLAEHKGHDDLLDALRDELLAHPSWKLLWVGDGWWRSRLDARIDALGLRGRVVTTGLVHSERVPALIRAVDLLVHPSYREGLPRTVPQALLCGVCPVAYDCDGTPEAIRDRETGLLVPTGDVDLLGEAVRWAYDHPTERAAMAARGRAECAVRFSADAMVAELERVYARAIGLARGPAGGELRGGG